MSGFTTIADACELVTDGTHYTPKDVGTGLPFLTVKDVSDSGLDFSGCSFISESDYLAAKSGNCAPMRGDVLFSKDGTVGKVHVVSTDQPFAVLSSLAILRPKAGKVDPGYLGHVLRFPAVLDDALKKKTGSAIRRIVLGDLKRVRLPLPSVEEQRRIAAILDQAETLRTQRRQALAHLDTLTQSLFLDMFGDPVTNPKQLPLLRGDQVCSRITVGIVVQPSSYYQNSGVPALRSLNIRPNKVVMENLVYFSAEDNEKKLAKTRVRKGDVLLVRTGQPGTAAVVPAELDGVNAIDILIATPDVSKVLADYLCFFYNSDAGKQMVLGAQRGQVQKHLNVGSMNAALIPVPPLELQQTFATRIQAIESLKVSHRAALAELDALFASLQQRAFSGALTRPAAAVQAASAKARDVSELCRLEADKGLEALIYVSKRMPQHDMYKSLKALYFGDKRHLEHHGALIYGEAYSALQHGPVPQAAYDLTKALEDDAAHDLFADDTLRATLRRVGNQLIPTRDADFSKLGAAERQSLDWAIRYCGSMSFEQTKTASHDAAYRATPPNAPMAMADIIRMLPEATQRRFFG